MIGMDDQIDFDAGAQPHALKNARTGKHRVSGLATGAVPFQPGTMTAPLDVERMGHLSSDRRVHCHDRPPWLVV